jgi:hypothetical protein
MYMVVVQKPMPEAVASRCCRRRFQQLAVARSAARCLMHVLGRSAKADAFGRSFAVFSTQVSAVGWRLRHSRLACGIMLEVSRDAVAER